MATPDVLAIPCKLDAFVLNAAVCGGSSKDPNDDENKNAAKIAPISQPNYTFLRFERTWVQNDILNFTDLHKTGPAAFNPRFTDLGTGEAITGRQGIYLHWIVPRPYRTGSAISQDATARAQARSVGGYRAQKAASAGTSAAEDDQQIPDDSTAPDFHPAPPRWLVIRKVEASDPPNVLPEVDAWVIESDRRQTLDDIPAKPCIDLQVDFSPFILGGDASQLTQESINEQAEVFIGYKEPASTWGEAYDPAAPADKQPLRVDLNLLNSSNQLFADYQPHNGNVFSTIDNLSYNDAHGKPQVVKTAEVSYYVVGWHSSDAQDPLGTLDPKGTITRGDRISALNMVLDQVAPADAGPTNAWLASKSPTRVLCHGAMYSVRWDASKKPTNVPADHYYQKLNSDMPVAVGTSASDALQAYINGHANPDDANGAVAKDIQADLLRLQTLRLSSSDEVEAQAEASDMLYDGNYSSIDGGGHYFLASSDAGKGDKGRPTAPNPEDIASLTKLNDNQRYLDTLSRQLQLLRWSMFVAWWQYLTVLDPNPDAANSASSAQSSDDIKNLSNSILAIMHQIQAAHAAVTKAASLIPAGMAQKGVLFPFYQARDPTMLVAGLETGWAWDYLNPLATRVDTELYYSPDTPPALDSCWTQFCSMVLPKLPAAVRWAAGGLISEFLALDPSTKPVPPKPQPDYQTPLYHDVDKKNPLPTGQFPWRDRWEDSQAWFPLFLEWEAEYTHVPFGPTDSLWTLDQRGAWPHDPVKLRYGIKPGVELAEQKPPLCDKRTVSGRVLLLPQATLTVQTMVKEALASASSSGLLEADDIQQTMDQLEQLSLLSSPLAGFTDHLLTRVQGNHVKPSVRDRGMVTPFQGAVDVGSAAGFKLPQLTMMGVETDLVPYATLVPYLDPNYCPFKPATHGQFRFTALNIIDKFGQAITAIDPTPAKDSEGQPPLYPCISEYFAPEVVDESASTPIANTVVQDKNGACQYMQLPPAINQPARLNAAFVDYRAATKDTAEGWQYLTEWEDPIWGWVVTNYADSGIQLFLPDGTFFREIRVGGPRGAAESGQWLPFDKPTQAVSSDSNALQLQRFADQLADANYLQSFIAMVNMSTGTAAPPPTAYSEFLAAIIGKPLALVKAGFSLELATNQLVNTSQTNTKMQPEVPLLASSADPTNHYSFQMQLGDASRVNDGLVAYFLPAQQPAVGNSLDLGTMFTHFKPDPSPDCAPTPNLTKIAEPNYQVISPFWVDPMADDIVKASSPGAAYAAKRTAQLASSGAIVGAIVDPFVPLHAYSGILPTAALSLPAWSWQQALSRMTAFFHMGPLLTTTDVPVFCPRQALGPDSYDVADPASVVVNSGLGIPAMQAGEWAWLQPYFEPSTSGPGQKGGTNAMATRFMAMDMAAVDQRPRFEKAPYVAVEGYMQLRKPIQQGEAPPQKA